MEGSLGTHNLPKTVNYKNFKLIFAYFNKIYMELIYIPKTNLLNLINL
jgi:hypothetical protein